MTIEQTDITALPFRRQLGQKLPAFVLTSTGVISSPTPAFLNLLGLAAGTAGRTLEQLTAPACHGPDTAFFHRPPNGQSVHHTILVHADGSPVPVLLLAAPADSDGSALCLCLAEAAKAAPPLIGYLLARQDDEKAQIARLLHDTTAQNLAALTMNLTMLSGIVSSDPRVVELLDECNALTAECLSEVRSLSYTLHPPLLDELGLVSALRSFVDAYSRRTAVTVQLDISPKFPRFPAETESRLFGIVQERLSYLEQFAPPSQCWISLEAGGPDVSLSISDDATCLLDDRLALSLTAINERARLAGFPLSISTCSHETQIRVIIARS